MTHVTNDTIPYSIVSGPLTDILNKYAENLIPLAEKKLRSSMIT